MHTLSQDSGQLGSVDLCLSKTNLHATPLPVLQKRQSFQLDSRCYDVHILFTCSQSELGQL